MVRTSPARAPPSSPLLTLPPPRAAPASQSAPRADNTTKVNRFDADCRLLAEEPQATPPPRRGAPPALRPPHAPPPRPRSPARRGRPPPPPNQPRPADRPPPPRCPCRPPTVEPPPSCHRAATEPPSSRCRVAAEPPPSRRRAGWAAEPPSRRAAAETPRSELGAEGIQGVARLGGAGRGGAIRYETRRDETRRGGARPRRGEGPRPRLEERVIQGGSWLCLYVVLLLRAFSDRLSDKV